MITQIYSIILAIFASLLGGIMSILFKKGAIKFNLNPFKQIKNYNMILGLFCAGTGMILFIIALKGGELSILYPIIALQYLWACIFSIYFLKEKMTKFKWLGTILIIIGISIISMFA